MHFLVTWVHKLNKLRILQPMFRRCRWCLLYVDDTLLLVKSEIQQLKLLKVILEVCENMSGLRINLEKSELLVTSMNDFQAQQLAQVMNCKSAKYSQCWECLALNGIAKS
jgi:Reverse transcriptase (RNA-dependent DNA polymerase)